jgi:peptidylprolyl isomerase
MRHRPGGVPVGCATVKDNREANSPHSGARRRLRSAALSALVLLVAAVLAAGCGSSETNTITIGNENTADNKLIAEANAAQPKTPTTGPLATKPKAEACKGPKPTKLETKDIVVGTGKEAKKGSKVWVNYVGVLCSTGKEFDSSWKRTEPFEFILGQGGVIAGWDQGIVGMKEGGRRELRIPAPLAYGKTATANIPANEALIFIVDLLKVE